MKEKDFYLSFLKFFSYLPIYLLSLNFIFIFINLNSFDSLSFIDHDEGYLLEQIILKINSINIERVVSRISEYGVEFYYLSSFFDFLFLFTNLSKINIYFISIFLHLILSIFSFVLIFKIFSKLKFKIYYQFLFSFIVISDPKIIYSSISLKPDLNVLLFFLILTVYFFINYLIKKKDKYLYLLIFTLSVSFTIKAWCLPFITFLFFISFYAKNNIFNFNKRNKFIFLLFIFLFMIMSNNYLVSLRNYLINDEIFLTFLNEIHSEHLIKKIIFYYENNFILIITFFNIFILLIVKLVYFGNKKINFLKCSISFLFSWFILAYPYLSSFNIFFKSILDSLNYTVFSELKTSESIYFFKNIFLDLNNLNFNFIIILILLLCPILYFTNFKKILKNNKLIIPFYITAIFSYIFINIFVQDYGDHFPAKYLYFIFILIFTFILIESLSKILDKFNWILLPIFLISFINLILNFNLYKNYVNYFTINTDYQNILNSHSKIFAEFDNLYVCDGVYPIANNFKNFSIIRISYDECTQNNIRNLIDSNDLVYIIDKSYFNHNLSNNLVTHHTDSHEFISRFGIKKLRSFNFYKLTK